MEWVWIGWITEMRKILKIWADITSNCFPETLKILFLVNTSSLLSGLFGMISGFIDEYTRKKIRVLKHDYMDVISEYIDRDNIPSILWGNCKCNNEWGCVYSDKGPWNP